MHPCRKSTPGLHGTQYVATEEKFLGIDYPSNGPGHYKLHGSRRAVQLRPFLSR